MFGPNSSFEETIVNKRSHRSNQVKLEITELQSILKWKFKLSEYNIYILFGPSTLAIESLAFSLPFKIIKNSLFDRGKFIDRIISLSSIHCKKSLFNTKVKGSVLFETSSSTLNNIKGSNVVDCVSAFPFYNDILLEESPEFFISCFNKQLSCPVGFSFIAIKEECESLFYKKNDSMLTLGNYIDNVHTTIPDYLLPIYIKRLENFDPLKENMKIKTNSQIITDALKDCEFVGETSAPTLTIKRNDKLDNLIGKYDLYHGPKYIQIFTYSEPTELYEGFAKTYATI